MLTIMTGKHDPDCSGCPECNEQCARMLDETPTQTALRCAAETDALWRSFQTDEPPEPRLLRARARIMQEYRVLDSLSESERLARKIQGFGTVVVETPDPYATPPPHAPCPFDDPRYQPRGTAPDGYAIALAKKENR